jgi:hypothetical protein
MLSHLLKVDEITNEMLKYEQVNIPVTNYFCDGIYARQINIPKDTFITGKIHKHENLAQLVSGTMRLISGNDVIGEITAPTMFVSPPGTARVALTLTDCIFITYHSTNGKKTEDDVPELLNDLSCSLSEYQLMISAENKEKICHS